LATNTVEKRRPSGHYLIAIILILSVILNIIQFSHTSNPSPAYQELEIKYGDLYSRYQTLSNQYQTLAQKHEQQQQVALVPPYVSISNGTIKWVFYDIKGRTITWQMPMDSYRNYVSARKPVQTLTFGTSAGSTTTYDMRPYIQPSFFENVISTLTLGRTAPEFVREVDNIKNQIITYGKGIGEAPYQFPAETLTEGRGVCADTTILMASMLIEGNRQAHYNFKVYIWYVQIMNDGTLVSESKSVAQANHAIIQVQFSDGTAWTIETTTNYFYTYSQAYTGWQFEVTAIDG
jgi:hypothetical protein